MIEDGTLVNRVLAQPDLYDTTASNMVACKSRGAFLRGATNYGNYAIDDTVDFVNYLPKADPRFTVSLTVFPRQLLGNT